MRFSLRAKSCANVNEVKTSLIKTRRIIFTPNSELKDELHSTAIQITCYDRNGDEIKRVTSSDPGTVEDPETDPSTEGGNGGTNGGSSNTGGNTGGDNNGGNTGGGGGGNDDNPIDDD